MNDIQSLNSVFLIVKVFSNDIAISKRVATDLWKLRLLVLFAKNLVDFFVSHLRAGTVAIIFAKSFSPQMNDLSAKS